MKLEVKQEHHMIHWCQGRNLAAAICKQSWRAVLHDALHGSGSNLLLPSDTYYVSSSQQAHKGAVITRQRCAILTSAFKMLTSQNLRRRQQATVTEHIDISLFLAHF